MAKRWEGARRQGRFVQTACRSDEGFRGRQFDVAMVVSRSRSTAEEGMFSTPIMREGKTPIARCSDKEKYGPSPISTSKAHA